MTAPASASQGSLYEIDVKTWSGEPVRMERFKGDVLLIVNVASRCGFTPQYEGLEALYRTFKDRGFTILAFPCNQFGSQEPGTNEEIRDFCAQYHVTFPLFAKIEVNGDGAHPLYDFLKSRQRGFLGGRAIRWNFTKFLVDRRGEVVARFGSTTTPKMIEPHVLALLE